VPSGVQPFQLAITLGEFWSVLDLRQLSTHPWDRIPDCSLIMANLRLEIFLEFVDHKDEAAHWRDQFYESNAQFFPNYQSYLNAACNT